MSKIEQELVAATDVTAKRGEDRQDYLGRLAKAVNALDDKAFNALSEDADTWVNKAFDAIEAKKDIPDFPDAEEEPKSEGRRSRRGSEEKAEAPAKPKVGDTVKVVTKRDKTYEGEVIELDEDIIAIKTADGEEEWKHDRLASVTVLGGGSKSKQDDDEPADPLVEGAEVTLVTARGRETTGKVVEVDKDVIVLDVDGKEKEFDREDIKEVKPAGRKVESTGRRSSSKSEDKAEAPATTGRRSSKSSADDDKPSAGIRIRQLCVEMYKEDGKLPPVADVAKALAKEGYEAKDNTVALNYAEAAKMFKIIEEAGLLK